MYWQWKGVLKQNIAISALTAHFDLYPTLTELAGATLPKSMQQLDGRTLLPLLNSPDALWDDRKLFIHTGRWNAGEMNAAKYGKYAVRTQRWRFVNNNELYDINADPGETENLASKYPTVVNKLRNAYEKWWEETVPLMINEGLPRLNKADLPLVIRYKKQLKESGIPRWNPNEI